MAKRQALGIDIDNYARIGGTNFALAKKLVQEGVYDFLIIKAGLGLLKSVTFDEQKQGAEQAGIPYLTYHFLDPVENMKKQARLYIEWVGKGQTTYIVDIERPRAEEEGGRLPTKKELQEYLAEIEKLTGKHPVLYSSMKILGQIGFLTEAEKYQLWLADYPYKNSATKELYRYFDDFLRDFKGTLPPSVRGKNLEKRVILWQFTKKGRGVDYIFNEKLPDNKDGKKSADLNISIKERDEFMKLMFGKVPPKPSSGDLNLSETLAQVEKMKQAGITPEVQININMADLNVTALKTLQGKLEKADVTAQVHVNIQAGRGESGIEKVSPDDEAEPPGTEPEPERSFTVEVKAKSGTKTAVQSIVDRKDNGVPVMGPHEPRIALPNGTRLRVSKTHKESDKDKGDGVIFGGKKRYYKIMEDAENGKAAGKFVKKEDVKPA